MVSVVAIETGLIKNSELGFNQEEIDELATHTRTDQGSSAGGLDFVPIFIALLRSLA